MTTQELQAHLKWLADDITGRQIIIQSLNYYIDHTLKRFKEFNMRPYIIDVEKYIKKERDEMERGRAKLEAWSQLIDNDDYRQIFIDRYMNGEKWEDIEEKRHYSPSTVFDIHRRCCEDIARKAVQEIVPGCNIQTDKVISI